MKRGTMGIPIYTADQIKGIREACRITTEVLELASKMAKPGVTTDEIDRCRAPVPCAGMLRSGIHLRLVF